MVAYIRLAIFTLKVLFHSSFFCSICENLLFNCKLIDTKMAMSLSIHHIGQKFIYIRGIKAEIRSLKCFVFNYARNIVFHRPYIFINKSKTLQTIYSYILKLSNSSLYLILHVSIVIGHACRLTLCQFVFRCQFNIMFATFDRDTFLTKLNTFSTESHV